MGKWKRQSCKRCGGEKLPGMGEMFCAVCKPIAAAERVEKTRQLSVEYKRRTYVPKPREVKVKEEKPKNVVPLKVRQAWGRAHPNSAIRKKFPTAKSLENHNWEQAA